MAPMHAKVSQLIEAKGLVKDFRTVRALDDVSLSVGRGEIFGFFGPNGAGKTTCIRTLCGLTRPTQGTADVMGVDVLRHPVRVRENAAIMNAETYLLFIRKIGTFFTGIKPETSNEDTRPGT